MHPVRRLIRIAVGLVLVVAEPRNGLALNPGDSPATFTQLQGPANLGGRFHSQALTNVAAAGGLRLVPLGDVNGDRHPDLGIALLPRGASPRPGSEPGLALVLLGATNGLVARPWFSQPAGPGDHLFGSIFRPIEPKGISRASGWLLGGPGGRAGPGNLTFWSNVTSPPAPGWTWHPGEGDLVSAEPVGDVNGDGAPDYLVALARSGAANRVILLLGTKEGAPTPSDWSYPGEQRDDEWGDAMVAAGDLDGDGLADVAIAAPAWRTRHGDLGRVAVFYGSKQLGLDGPFWVGTGREVGDRFGRGLAGACDFDGDGFDDLAIGAPGMQSTGQSGYVQVFRGGTNRPPRRVAEKSGMAEDRRYGSTVAWLHGFNRDGRGNLAVGAPRSSRQAIEGGAFEILSFSSPDFVLQPVLVIAGTQASAHYGSQLTSPGDLDGDGLSDLVVGSPGLDLPRIDAIFGGPFSRQAPQVWAVSGRAKPTPAQKTDSGVSLTSGPGARHLPWIPFALAGLAFGGLFVGARRILNRRSSLAHSEESRDAALQAERTRIAQDLHDRFGRVITDLAVQSATASGAQPLRELLDQVIWDLETGPGTLEGFATFLAEYVPERVRAHSIEAALDLPLNLPEVNLTAGQRQVLACAMTEAITNALRHGRATRIAVALTCEGSRLTLRVDDNGQGFDLETENATRRGLRGLRERLRAIGGETIVTTAPGRRTRLEFVVPLDQSGAARG